MEHWHQLKAIIKCYENTAIYLELPQNLLLGLRTIKKMRMFLLLSFFTTLSSIFLQNIWLAKIFFTILHEYITYCGHFKIIANVLVRDKPGGIYNGTLSIVKIVLTLKILSFGLRQTSDIAEKIMIRFKLIAGSFN